MTLYTIRDTVERVKQKTQGKKTMETVTLKEARSQFKSIGYKLKVKTYSDFKHADIVHIETNKNLTSVLSRKDYDFHKTAIELRDCIKGNIYDGLYRVTI